MDLKKLGKYEIVSKIGEGAMGEVYKAYDPVLGRDVAVKTMSATIGSDNELRQRFEREARSAARLNHPNIITVYDFGEEQGRAFITMELLEGEDLSELISRRASMNLETKVSLMEQMAEGLAFAHARDVVHRDLKPGNIHIQRGGQVKIMDFGLARLSTSNMTRAGMVMGTPNYMSPEQVRGERATARSDVFSLGSVFYELLTYHKPFDADSLHAVLFQVMQSEPEPIATAVPGLPPPLRHVVERAMAKDPNTRFKDAAELREALRSVRAGISAAHAAPSPLDLPTMAFPAAPERIPTARAPVTAGAGPSTAVAIVPEATRLDAPPEATVAQDAVTLSASPATQAAPPPTQLAARPATRRPGTATAPPASHATPSLARPVPAAQQPAARLVLIGGGAAVLVVAAGLVGVLLTREAQSPVPPPATAAPSSPVPPSAAPSAEPSAQPPLDLGPAVAEARRSLEARDYRTALSRAEAVLAMDRGNAAAEKVLGDARDAIRTGDAAARDLRSALDARDADRASSALKRLGSVDPRNPELAALTVRVGDVVSRRAAEAQRALQEAEARRRAPPATPAPTPRATPVPQATAPPPTPHPTPPPPTVPTAPPPTAAPAPLTPAQVELARRAIRGVLDEYRTAVGTLNAEYLRRLHPKVDYEGMRANFGNVQEIDVKIDVKDVAVAAAGDTATAQCLVTYTPKPKPVGRMKPVPTTFKLRRTGTNLWIIDEVEVRR